MNYGDSERRVAEWESRHTKQGKPIRDPSGNWLLYPDGATRELSTSGLGRWRDPPEDAKHRNTLILAYWEARLVKAEAEATEFKTKLQNHFATKIATGHSSLLAGTDEELVGQYKALRAESNRVRAKRRKADERLHPKPSKEQRQQQRKEDIQFSKAQQKYVNKLTRLLKRERVDIGTGS